MATIDKRPDRPKPWRVRYRDLSGSQRTRSFRRKVDAERFRVWVLNEQMQGMWIDPQRGKTPVGEWAEHWFVTTTELRSSTRLRTRSVLDLQFTPGFRLLLMVGVCRCFPVVCGLFVVCHTCGLTARPQVVATSDEELFIALTEQADAAYAEEGYDASARYRCYAEVLSESLPQWMETPDREMLAEAGVDPRSLAPGDEPQAVAVLAQAGLDADDEASDHWLQSNFEQLQAVLACCSPIALPARRRRACRLRDTRFRSR